MTKKKKGKTIERQSDTETDNETHTQKQHKKRNTGSHEVEIHTQNNSATESQTPNVQHINTQHATGHHTPNTQNTQRIQNTYTERDNGTQFKLIMEKENINEISIGRLFAALGLKHVSEIRKTGKNRLQITTTDKNDANKILTCETINKIKQIKTFIPRAFIFTVGVVKNVPLDLTDDEIFDASHATGVYINKVERMFFWDKTTKTRKPSLNVKIEFRSTTLPQEMIVFYVRKKVEYFIPRPTVCKTCLRYGHVATICKSHTKLCVNCTAPTHIYSPDCECNHCLKLCQQKCKHCNTEDHNTMHASCPHMKIQQTIKTYMITKNICFNEAKTLTENENAISNTTYANIVNNSNETDKLKQEIITLKATNNETEKLKQQIKDLTATNKQLKLRVKSAENIIRQLVPDFCPESDSEPEDNTNTIETESNQTIIYPSMTNNVQSNIINQQTKRNQTMTTKNHKTTLS